MNKSEARKFLKSQAGNVWTAITELSLAELEEVKKIADNYSTTNCWFGEYWMKETFIQMIDDRIAQLKLINKRTG